MRRLASVSVIIIGLGVMVALPLVVLELVAPRVHPLDRVMSVTDPSEQHHAYTCIAGALSKTEYETGLADAGFGEISVAFTDRIADGMHSAIVKALKH